jgi:hypothetical protein
MDQIELFPAEVAPAVVNRRTLRTIAREIRATWPRVYFGAVPYLDAMGALDTLTDRYYEDDARSIVLYFLSNAGTWRGPDAKRIKAELRAMLDGK